MPLLPIRVLAAVSVVLISSGTLAGEVLRDQQAPSPALGQALSYTIYLPDGHAEPDAGFPVIYFLHGFGGGQREWFHAGRLEEVLDRLIEAGEIRPVIAVSPSAGKSWYVDSAEYGGPGDYETAIVGDLVAEIDRAYPTLSDSAHRAVAGISMGGHGALRFAFAHPNLFSAVAALSPGIWKLDGVSWSQSPQFDSPDDLERLFPRTTGETFDLATFGAQSPFSLVADIADHEAPPRVLLTTGDDDELALNDGTVEMYLDLRAYGLRPELRVTDGGHNWRHWRQMVDEVLHFFDQGWENAEGAG